MGRSVLSMAGPSDAFWANVLVGMGWNGHDWRHKKAQMHCDIKEWHGRVQPQVVERLLSSETPLKRVSKDLRHAKAGVDPKSSRSSLSALDTAGA